MKIKSKTKKAIVLSVMVVLLIATGVLNWALNERLDGEQANADGGVTVTETFFASYRSDRDATRESEYLYLDAIIKSEDASAESKASAEQKKLDIVTKMETELALETLVKAKGFDDAIVAIGEDGVNVVVGAEELTPEQATQILCIVTDETDFKATDVKIIPYN